MSSANMMMTAHDRWVSMPPVDTFSSYLYRQKSWNCCSRWATANVSMALQTGGLQRWSKEVFKKEVFGGRGFCFSAIRSSVVPQKYILGFQGAYGLRLYVTYLRLIHRSSLILCFAPTPTQCERTGGMEHCGLANACLVDPVT